VRSPGISRTSAREIPGRFGTELDHATGLQGFRRLRWQSQPLGVGARRLAER